MKTVVVSDLHGCSMEFSALLRKAGLNRQEDRLVILGDLFDRGNHSYDVMKKVGRLHEEMGDRFFLVRGNHDQFLLDYIEGKIPLQLWALNGGLKTIESFRSHQTELDEPAALLKDTPLFVRFDEFIGVHAGLISEIPEENDEEVLLWDRSVTYGSYKGRLAVGGHTPMKNPVWFMPDGTPVELEYETEYSLPDRGFICIDTGCVFGRKLTALVIQGDRYHLVPMRKLAY